MFGRDTILGVWVALALALAASLAGWALTKVDSAFPPWAPQAAFALAGALVVLAIGLGIFAGAKASPEVAIARSWVALAKEIFAATRRAPVYLGEPFPHHMPEEELRRYWAAKLRRDALASEEQRSKKREQFQQRIAVASKEMDDLGIRPPRQDITIANDFCLEAWAKVLAGEGEKILSGRPRYMHLLRKPFTPPPSPGDPDF